MRRTPGKNRETTPAPEGRQTCSSKPKQSHRRGSGQILSSPPFLVPQPNSNILNEKQNPVHLPVITLHWRTIEVTSNRVRITTEKRQLATGTHRFGRYSNS